MSIDLAQGRRAVERELVPVLREIIRDYPEMKIQVAGEICCHPDYPLWADRTAYDMSLVLERTGSGEITVVDVGGGRGLFSLGFARLGARSIIIDDHRGAHEGGYAAELKALFDRYGVEMIERDAIAEPPDLPASADAITAFHFMEHVHNSPRPLFRKLASQLNPGGVFVLGGPNCANLRKRFATPLGRQKWSPMSDWYEREVFRGHVREPDVDDLRYIARDLDLADISISGRNYFGIGSPRRARRVVARMADPALRLRPTLCSEIYMAASKPA